MSEGLKIMKSTCLYDFAESAQPKFSIKRTGNPFVDQGLCCLAALCNLEGIKTINRISDMTLADIQNVFNSYDIAYVNKHLKSFTQTFGVNGPLYQNAFHKQGIDRVCLYRRFLEEMLKGIEIEGTTCCECCGRYYSFDINDAWSVLCREFNLNDRGRKYVGRDFFPLIGSIGNDAQALPCGSKMHNVCPLCLFAVNYIPLSTFSFGGGIVCYEGTSEELMLDLIEECVRENRDHLSTNQQNTSNKKGHMKVIENFLSVFSKIQGNYKISDFDIVVIWYFSNSGQRPHCNTLEIPNNVLKFLLKLSKKSSDLKEEFKKMILKDKNRILFDAFLESEDCNAFYPYKKNTGASPELYELYQINVVGREISDLDFAKKIAQKMTENLSSKEREKNKKSDLFDSPSNRNKVRRIIYSMIISGEAEYDDYARLFNPESKYLKPDTKKDYNPVMYYLYNL